MSETVHPWCRDPARDEAIRAAEDAAAAERTPLPDHRDLPSAVAELRERVARLEAVAQPRPEPTTGSESVTQARRVGNWRWFDKSSAPPPPPPPAPPPVYWSSVREGAPPQPAPVQITEGDTLATVRDGGGRPMPKGPPPGLVTPPTTKAATVENVNADGLRTERVTLEITMLKGGHKYHGDASSWDWKAILRHGQNFFGPGECVRVVEDSDAASDEAIAHGATLNALAEARESLAAVNRGIDRLTAERDAALRERDAHKDEYYALRSTTTERELAFDALRARVAELEAAAAPAANAGGEANQPWPMAFAVWGRGAVCGVTVSREDAGAMQREFAFDTEVMPLYAAPQPPRGWLTEEERSWLKETLDQCRKNIDARLDEGNEEGAKIVSITCARLCALLARSTPPMVKVPKVKLGGFPKDRDDAWIAAIREAGGEVE